jgi:hypothetical protein
MRRSRRVDQVRPDEESESLAAIDLGAEVDTSSGSSRPQRLSSRSGFTVGAIAVAAVTALLITLVVVTHRDPTHPVRTTTSKSPKHVVPDLGECPSTNSSFGSTGMNAGVRDLTAKLVPITASNVLICRYGLDTNLARVAVLEPVAAARLEADTNRLPTSTRGTAFSCRPARESFRLTFANDTHQVQVQESCGGIINGAAWARATAKWLSELERYPSSAAPPPESCCGTP